MPATATGRTPSAPEAPLALIVHGASHTHMRRLVEWRNPAAFRVVGLIEPDAGLREKHARAFGLTPETAVATFAELPAVAAEAVVGFGSVAGHVQVVADAMALGLPVMLEKPLATTTADVERIAHLSARHDLPVLTHYETDAYASLAELATAVRTDEIGAPRRIIAAHGHPGPVERGVNPECLAWLTDPAQGGGALTDFGCYGIAQTLWLMDGRLPDRVTARGWTRQPDLYGEVEDDATIILDYPGCSAVIQPSWCWPQDRKELTVFGERGTLHAKRAEELYAHDRQGEVHRRHCPDLPADRRDPFLRLAAVARDGLSIKEHDPTHLDNAVATVRLLAIARESVRLMRTVSPGDSNGG